MLDVPDSTPLIAIVNLFKYHGFVKTSIFQRSDILTIVAIDRGNAIVRVIHCEEALDSTNGSSNSSLLALLASQCIVCLSQDVSAVLVQHGNLHSGEFMEMFQKK
jgi:hypothetical protein